MTEIMTPETKQFVIPEENLGKLVAKIESLSKKAVRITGKPINFRVVDEIRKPVMKRDPITRLRTKEPLLIDGEPVYHVSFKVEVEAVCPKIEGWTFVGTIDHSAAAGNLIHLSPVCGIEEVPERYRTVRPVCEHCNKIRSRRDTYLLREDATGKLKQIGRQCVRDYIGYDIAHVVEMAELLASVVNGGGDDDDFDYGNMPRDRRWIFVRSYLAHVNAMIRTHGWLSSTEAKKNAEYGNFAQSTSTAQQAVSNYCAKRGAKGRVELVEKDFATADAALDWAKTMTPRRDNEYEYKLNVLAQEDLIETRNTGIVASMINAYARAKEMEIKRADRRDALNLTASKHIGKEGDRLRDISAILYGFYALPEGMYGARYIYRFRTDDGNVLVWIASADAAEKLEMGGMDAANRIKVKVTGTVKKHTEYEGVKQTVLSRCAVEKIEEKQETC